MTNKEKKFVRREVNMFAKILEGVEHDYGIPYVICPCSKKEFPLVKQLIEEINKTSMRIKISISSEENREIKIEKKVIEDSKK